MAEIETCAAQCETPLDETVKIIAVCPAGHRMHAECVYKMYETTAEPACPICRDDTLNLLKDMIIKADKNPKIDNSSDEEINSDDSEAWSDTSDAAVAAQAGAGIGNNYFDFTVADNGHMTVNVYYAKPPAESVMATSTADPPEG